MAAMVETLSEALPADPDQQKVEAVLRFLRIHEQTQGPLKQGDIIYYAREVFGRMCTQAQVQKVIDARKAPVTESLSLKLQEQLLAKTLPKDIPLLEVALGTTPLPSAVDGSIQKIAYSYVAALQRTLDIQRKKQPEWPPSFVASTDKAIEPLPDVPPFPIDVASVAPLIVKRFAEEKPDWQAAPLESASESAFIESAIVELLHQSVRQYLWKNLVAFATEKPAALQQTWSAENVEEAEEEAGKSEEKPELPVQEKAAPRKTDTPDDDEALEAELSAETQTDDMTVSLTQLRSLAASKWARMQDFMKLYISNVRFPVIKGATAPQRFLAHFARPDIGKVLDDLYEEADSILREHLAINGKPAKPGAYANRGQKKPAKKSRPARPKSDKSA